MLAGNLADALKQIPADQIKAIEVVTSPSAKYDAEGSGGVINIVLKTNTLQGTNGNLGANAGNRNQRVSGSLNVRRGKLGVNTRLNGFYNTYPYSSSLSRTDFTPAGEGQLTQNTSSSSQGGYGTGSVLLQSRYSGYYYSLGLKRTFLKDKADLTFNANNFFTPGREFRSTTTDQFVS